MQTLQGEQPLCHQVRDHMGSISGSGLKSNILDMPRDCARRDVQFDRDFLCREPLCDKSQYFYFARSKMFDVFPKTFHIYYPCHLAAKLTFQ